VREPFSLIAANPLDFGKKDHPRLPKASAPTVLEDAWGFDRLSILVNREMAGVGV